jgi:HEPN domain-containing protein
MFDKVEYWLELCDEDLRAAKTLFDAKNYLWMGFICHLIAEKALKAVIASITDEVPPKIHDLKSLAKRADIADALSEDQLALLEQLNPLQIEARYPEYKANIATTLSHEKCQKIYCETEGFLCWIKQWLDKSQYDIQK